MSDPTTCLNCGAPSSPETPIPSHCQECPPWTCEDCGQPCSAATLCVCWVSLDGKAFADVKALFAASDLSLVLPPALRTGGHHE